MGNGSKSKKVLFADFQIYEVINILMDHSKLNISLLVP